MYIDTPKTSVKRMVPDFSVVPSDGVRRDGHELKHREFHLDMRNSSFTLRVTEPWNRLRRDTAESPILEIVKTHRDTFLCNCSRGPCLARVLE